MKLLAKDLGNAMFIPKNQIFNFILFAVLILISKGNESKGNEAK